MRARIHPATKYSYDWDIVVLKFNNQNEEKNELQSSSVEKSYIWNVLQMTASRGEKKDKDYLKKREMDHQSSTRKGFKTVR